jgi:hypothetical protein
MYKQRMYLFYLDDSGDTGLKSKGSPTEAFVLCSLIVADHEWLTTLDAIKDFRNFLWKEFRLKQRDELKAAYLIHNAGPFEELNLSDKARMNIYRMALRFQQKTGAIKTWAVLIAKDKLVQNEQPSDIRDMAWQQTIQRIERYTYYGKDGCVVFPDEGDPAYVRAMFRQMRRYSQVPSAFNVGQTLSRPATFIVEDPNFRLSHESYFIQLADLNAYAAYRCVYPKPYFGAGYWNELGDARVKDVSKKPRMPIGISIWPAP